MRSPSTWLEIEITREGAQIRASARAGSSAGQAATHLLGPELGADALLAFADGVHAVADRGEPLGASLLAQAEAIHRALFRDGIDALRGALQAADGGPLLVRLRIHDAALRKVPWEAIAAPGQVRGFVGTAADLVLARAPDAGTSEEHRPLREVREALRVLVVAPQGWSTVEQLRSALQDRIDSGEVVLEACEGAAAEPRRLLEHLRTDVPNVLHFVCHGGVVRGAPALLLGDGSDESMWLSVAALAQHLEAWCSGPLRLVVLEACAGANPTDVASAAEILARKSVDAVVAHLWPVEADVARVCSVQLYSALAGADRTEGSVAAALNDARRILLAERGETARAFSPVLYLRTGTAALFDLRRRRLVKPETHHRPEVKGADPALITFLEKPFSVIIGDRSGAEGAALDDLQKRLAAILSQPASLAHPGLPIPVPPGLPLSALAQRVAFYCGNDVLGGAFQKTFKKAAVPPLLDALARVTRPGVHITLLRSPLFEQALARSQPERTLFVLQPGEKETAVLCRKGGSGEEWETLLAPPPSLDLTREIVVLRLYRGYTPELDFTSPLLTEDNFLLDLRELESVLPPDLADGILKAIDTTPALLLGLSLHLWDHRQIFREVLRGKPIPNGSLAVVEPASPEVTLWREGAGLPRGSQVRVVEATGADLTRHLAAFAEGGES